MNHKDPLFNFLSVSVILCFLFLPTTASVNSIAVSRGVRIAPVPDWVTDTVPSDILPTGNQSISKGYYYVLLNYQDNIAEKQRFSHTSVKLMTSEGVQTMSDLSVSFDPSYQTVSFHSIDVIRNGTRINKLNSKEFKVIQREEDMDRFLYDGRLTAVMNLTDIRVGDIIDFSYSVIGENPVTGGLFARKIYLQHTVPVEHLIYRLIVPANHNIKMKYFNGASQAVKSMYKKDTVYTWRSEKLKPTIFDINTPSWYDPFPSVSFSEYGSWEKIVKQFAAFYSESDHDRELLKNRLKGYIHKASEDSIIVQATRFVQDHIRYLGFENGLDSHKPMQPLKVLECRFGDCKAKSFLLCEILKSYNISAYPLLVNSDDCYSVINDLPSPNSFNHCVVEIEHKGGKIYVDPTISFQGGDLQHLVFPDYHYGLLLKDGITEIDSIPFKYYYRIRACEKYTLDSVGGSANLVVTTRYTGGEADNIRDELSNLSPESIEKEYLDFYSKLFPDIKTTGSFRITDDRDGLNEFVVEEYYRIDKFWQITDTASNKLSAEIYPLSIEHYFSDKKSPHRTMPYEVVYPVDYEHTSIIKLPENWKINDTLVNVVAPSFRYKKTIHYSNNEVTVVHRYKTYQDHIDANQTDDFITKHNDIMKDLSFILTYAKGNGVKFRFSLFAGLFSLIVIGISIFFAVKLYNYDTKTEIPDIEPQPLGGWLVLVGIGIILTPARLLFDMYKAPEFFNGILWSNLFDFNNSSKNMIVGLIMIFELFTNNLRLVFSVLLLFLFLKRRTTFPLSAIIYYLFSLTVLIGDTMAVGALHIGGLETASDSDTYKSLTQTIFYTAIWIPYLLRSKRVKQTFVMKAANSSGLNDIDSNDHTIEPSLSHLKDTNEI